MTYDQITPIVDSDLPLKQTNSCVENEQEEYTLTFSLTQTDINDVTYTNTTNIIADKKENNRVSKNLFDKIDDAVVDIYEEKIDNWMNEYNITMFYYPKCDDQTLLCRYIIKKNDSMGTNNNTVEYVKYILDVYHVLPTFWQRYFSWFCGSRNSTNDNTTNNNNETSDDFDTINNDLEEDNSSKIINPTEIKEPKKRSCSMLW